MEEKVMDKKDFDPNDLDEEFHKAQKTIPDNPSKTSAAIVLIGTVAAFVWLYETSCSFPTPKEPEELRINKEKFQQEIDLKMLLKREQQRKQQRLYP